MSETDVKSLCDIDENVNGVRKRSDGSKLPKGLAYQWC